MKRTIKSILIITSAVMLSFGCKKSSSSNTSNSTNGNLSLKYEIITSVPVVNSFNIMYLNGTDQWENSTFSSGGTYWSKDVTITSTTRPFDCVFQGGIGGGASPALSTAGTITCNIYLNGVLKAHSVNNSTLIGNINLITPSASYIILP